MMRAVLGVILQASHWSPRLPVTRSRWRQDRWRESYRRGPGRAGHRDDEHRRHDRRSLGFLDCVHHALLSSFGRRFTSRPPSVGHRSPTDSLLANNVPEKGFHDKSVKMNLFRAFGASSLTCASPRGGSLQSQHDTQQSLQKYWKRLPNMRRLASD
jgi:hypothetical protein